MTGATGFVGGALARQLRDAGHEVAALGWSCRGLDDGLRETLRTLR